ncbi:hypothetical protein GCM10010416_63650 [Streptomyces caniferus]
MTISAMCVVSGFAFGGDGCRRRAGCGTWGRTLGRDESKQAVVHRLASARKALKAPKGAAASTGE